MHRRTRNLLLLLALLLVAGLVLGAAVLGPRIGAVRCLITFGWPVPEDIESFEKIPGGYELLEDEARYGAPRILLRRIPDDQPHATLVFVHGVAKIGIRDGRILRAVEAFHRAGFTVVAPEIGPLLDPTRSASEVDRLDRVLDALADGRIPGAKPTRFGLVGISVGGALALRSAASFQERGGKGLRALLAIGAPDDLRTSAREWFALPDPAKEGGDSHEWRRRNAAAFARNFVARAALEKRLGSHADAAVLRDWMAEEPLPTAEVPTLETEPARALARFIHAAPAERERAGDALLADAWDRLVVLSPADWSSRLEHLSGVAVFLLHGEQDPLVPVAEAARLEARLAEHTIVSVLRSRLLGHTSVGDASLGDKLDHVVFLDDFFDMVGD